LNKLLRFFVILFFGAVLALGASCFLIHSAEKASAAIYWGGGQASDTFFLGKLNNLGHNAVFGGPVTINGSNGHFVVYKADASVPKILGQLKNQFSQLPSDNTTIKEGSKTGFYIAEYQQRTCALMLVNDDNIQKTWLFALMMPKELFNETPQPFVNEDGGVDPVAELRPPGSTRVFCFETPAIAFAAYKSINGNLADFYESALSTDDRRGISIMSFTKAKLPDNGNLFFFDSSNNKGFVVYQSDPKNDCSYAIVCAQMQ
jgi:hypothetical protein